MAILHGSNSFRVDQDAPEAGVYASKGNIVVPGNGATDRSFTRSEATLTAPAGGSVVADTGQLPAGTYQVSAQLAFLGVPAVAKDIQVQHRDATNTSTVETLGTLAARNASGGGATNTVGPTKVAVVANDRIRVVTGATAASAGEYAEAILIAQRIA